jgi:hypothetical protein
MLCKICETRRPRRYCPGVAGNICSICCGTEREETVQCPFDCEYLQEARVREHPPTLNPDEIPHKDIRVSEKFLMDNELLLMFISGSLFETALQTPGTIDYDVREALQALIKTYRTLDSGLYYESRPTNPLAANLYQTIQDSVKAYRDRIAQETGMNTIRDTDVLGILVFLQRMELQQNNGRKKGRAFLDFLRGFVPQQPASPLLL